MSVPQPHSVPPGTPKRIYLASTPYHLLLIFALQHRDGEPDASVFFVDEARLLSHAPHLRDAFCDHLKLCAAPALGGHPLWQYPFRCRLTARSAAKFVRDLGAIPSDVFVTNGMRPEAQRVFGSLSGEISFKSIEDGLDSYIDCNQTETALWERIFHRVSCGSPHPLSGDMVTAHSYDRYYVVAPELARAPHCAVESIPPESVLSAAAVMREGLRLAGSDRAITDLYVLANSERIPDLTAYLASLRAVSRERAIGDPNTHIAIKAHPREANPRMLAAIRELSDYFIPHWIPLELVAATLSPVVSIHCGLTTFIVSSRLLVPGRLIHLDHTVRAEHARVLQRWDPTIAWGGDGAAILTDSPRGARAVGS